MIYVSNTILNEFTNGEDFENVKHINNSLEKKRSNVIVHIADMLQQILDITEFIRFRKKLIYDKFLISSIHNINRYTHFVEPFFYIVYI